MLAALLLPDTNWGQSHALELAQFKDSIDLLRYASEWADSADGTSFDSARTKTFGPLHPVSIGSIPRWWRVHIHNNAAQPVSDILLMAPRCSWVALFETSGDSGLVNAQWNGGVFTNYPHRSYPLNPVCFPLVFAPGEYKTLWLRVRHFELEVTPVYLLLRPAMERQIHRDGLLGCLDGVFYNGIFWGILVFFTLLSTLQYIRLREQAVLYYALYSAALALYYLRNLELAYDQPILFAWAMRHFIQWEIVLQYAAYLAYMLFLRTFLDTREQRPALDRLVRAGLWTYSVLLPLNLVVQAVFGEMAGLQLHVITRAGLLLLLLSLLIYLFRQQDVLGRFMSVGLLLLLLPVLLLAVERLLGWTHENYWGGALRNTEGIWFYSPMTGILLEIICFYLGLLHRNKLASVARDAAEIRLATEIEARTALQKSYDERLKNLTAALSSERSAQAEDPLLTQLRAVLAERYADESFGVPALCHASGISRSHLHRRLAALTGESASVFIRNYRLDRACLLLREGRLTVAEVAYRTGFSGPGYFSRIFTERFGMPPSAFREGKNGGNGT